MEGNKIMNDHGKTTLGYLFAAVCLYIGCVFFGPCNAEASPTPDGALDAAIMHLTERAPAHPVRRNERKREALVNSIQESSKRYRLDPMLVTTIIYRESSFRTNRRGFSNNETGLMQVHGKARRGCELTTVSGQVNCGARWLRKCMDVCDGTAYQALTAYATGECKHNDAGVRSKVRSRIRLWEKLKRQFQ
jgi:hypothetical protein